MTEQEWLTTWDPLALLNYLRADDEGARRVGVYRSDILSDRKFYLWACAALNRPEREVMSVRGIHRHQGGTVVIRYADSGSNGDNENEYVRDVPRAAALLRSMLVNPFAGRTYQRDGGKLWVRIRTHAQREIPLTPTVLEIASGVYNGEQCADCDGRGYVWTDTGGNVGQGHCRNCDDQGYIPFDPTPLPILADALETAGCTDEFLLRHLRGYDVCTALGPHHADLCSGGRIQSPNAQFTQNCAICRGVGWIKATIPRMRGDWAMDLLLGKE